MRLDLEKGFSIDSSDEYQWHQTLRVVTRNGNDIFEVDLTCAKLNPETTGNLEGVFG